MNMLQFIVYCANLLSYWSGNFGRSVFEKGLTMTLLSCIMVLYTVREDLEMEQNNRNERNDDFSDIFRRRGGSVNSLKEDFLFSNCSPHRLDDLIVPVMAGITHPDPDYFCKPNQSDPVAPHLYVLEYVIKGEGKIECRGKCYSVKAGDCYLLCPAHGKRWCASRQNPYEKKWFNVAGRYVESLLSAFGMDQPIYIAPINIENEMDEIHRILIGYDIQKAEKANLQLMQLLMGILYKIYCYCENTYPKTVKATFEDILGYISANLIYKPLNTATISYQFYVSDRTLLRMFEKNLGITPAKYIAEQKLDYAKRLLTTTNYPVKKISDTLFFSEPRHFRKVFMESTGMNPIEWRKRFGLQSGK